MSPLSVLISAISNSLTSNIWHCRRWWWWASWAWVWLGLGLARRLRTSSLWLKSSASDSSPSLTSHVSGHVGQARIHVSPSHRTQRPHKQTRGSDSFLTTPSHLSRGVFRWAVHCGVLIWLTSNQWMRQETASHMMCALQINSKHWTLLLLAARVYCPRLWWVTTHYSIAQIKTEDETGSGLSLVQCHGCRPLIGCWDKQNTETDKKLWLTFKLGHTSHGHEALLYTAEFMFIVSVSDWWPVSNVKCVQWIAMQQWVMTWLCKYCLILL